MFTTPRSADSYRYRPVVSRSARWHYLWDVLRELVARDMRLRYRGSLLGLAWTLLNPLSELVVLLFVFNVIVPLNIPNFGAFLFTGLLAYAWFSTSLTFATGAIVNSRELVRSPGVPTAILPVVTVASTFVHFFLSLPVLLGLVLLSGIHLTSAAMFLPVVIVIQFLLTLAFAYPLAVVHVWFRDTQHFLRIGLQLLFYLTPIFYEASNIPERFRTAYYFNPLVGVVEGYRDVLLRGRPPAFEPLAWLLLASTVLLVVGVNVFRRTSHKFAEEL